MPASLPPYSRGWALASCVPALLVLGLGLAAYGSPAVPDRPGDAAAGRTAAAPAAPPSGAPTTGAPVPDAAAADPFEATHGLAAERDGYRLAAGPAELPAGRATGYPFAVTGPDGTPVTAFTEHQGRRLHFYAVRADLTGFQHLHPVMAADGTWTADLAALAPGTWRMYASFVPDTGAGRSRELVLSRTVTVPGEAAPVPLPAPAAAVTVDGYTVDLRTEPAAGAHLLTASFRQDGRPVTDLEPYLESYAHLTAFHEGDQALAHLHPASGVTGPAGGPRLGFHALLGKPGNWRVFLQFQTAGRLHTAEFTVHVD